jgi:hypothetical protein
VINRRLHKRDQSRDVLEKVTLIKDIAFGDPIRAHVEILNDFALANLDAHFGVSNFVALHAAWLKRLGSYALSNDFYREIADWYFWAHHQVDDGTIRLPQDCDTEQERSIFLIRLLTRIIFCWSLVEKRLLPAELFREHSLRTLLKDLAPNAGSYYHSVLQNLFFGTLNMPAEQRGFREKKKDGERYDKNFGITNLWRYEAEFRTPADWNDLAARVPFLNGGLFDCLDEKTGQKQEHVILDGFSDNARLGCRADSPTPCARERRWWIRLEHLLERSDSPLDSGVTDSRIGKELVAGGESHTDRGASDSTRRRWRSEAPRRRRSRWRFGTRTCLSFLGSSRPKSWANPISRINSWHCPCTDPGPWRSP